MGGVMAFATRLRTVAYRPSKSSTSRKISAHEAQKAKEDLLDDLMNDARKCFAGKSAAERKAIAFAISKIANS